MNNRGKLAISQILILVIGIVAISYAIGSSLGEVRGDFSPRICTSSIEDKMDCKYSNGNAGAANPSTNPLPTSLSSISLDSWNFNGKEITKIVKATSAGTTQYVGITKNNEQIILKEEDLKDIGLIDSKGNFKPGTRVGNWLVQKGYGLPISNFVGQLAQGLWWSIIVVGVIQTIGNWLGVDSDTLNAASIASFGGIMSGQGTYGLIKEGGYLSNSFESYLGDYVSSSTFSIGIGAGVGVLIFLASYKSEETKTITFTCEPWDAPTGGEYCEKCNQQEGGLPCSEYQCRSLGQSCELLNQGTDEEKCVWVNRNDVEPPTIEPAQDVLSDGFEYSPDNAISPPDYGVKIINKESTGGCVEAFQEFTFGITTNEPAKCKLDPERKENFEDMNYYFGGSSLSTYNHTQKMSLPGPSALEAENLTLKNDGNFNLYVRCQDANGNSNTANFVFEYCVEKGPDTTPPKIVTTNLLNNMPIAYNQSSIDIELYTNEPADCRWSHSDQSYDDMETDMSCSDSVFDMNAQMLYKCETTLDGIKDKVNNDFFFRCRDQPSLAGTSEESNRNTDVESYKFTIIGTQPLVINNGSLMPNGTIKDSTTPVKVTLQAETSAGYDEGNAICYYTPTSSENDDGSFIMFFNTNSYKHSQDLYLGEGSYEYTIKCIDLGGNSDIGRVAFNVDVDNSAPAVVRAYKEESNLKIITDEKAECVYSTDTSNKCNYLFEDGTALSRLDDEEVHFTDWVTENTYYIKCQDEYLNSPNPDECSIIVKPFDASVS